MESLSALVSRTQSGDKQAENELFERLRPFVSTIARSSDFVPFNGGGDADGSDLTQATLLRVAKSIPEYRGSRDPQFKAWIRQILCHQAIDLVRRNSPALSLDQSADGDLLRNQLAADGSTPSGQFMRGEQAVRLLEMLEKLPDDQQRAVRWRYLDGLPIQEVARRLGNRTEGAAVQLIRRGVSRLGRLLTGQG